MLQSFSVRSQSELLAHVEMFMRSVGSKIRWTDEEIYLAINDAVQMWGPRVKVPFILDLDDWSNSEKQYELPSYASGDIDAQFRRSEADNTWQSFPYQSVTDGGILSLVFYPPGANARVLFWRTNGPLPTTIPNKTVDDMSSTADSVVISDTLSVDDVGYILIDQEWMQYRGVERGATTTTLQNLQRAQFSTMATSHNGVKTVQWGVVVHRPDLWQQMDYQIRSRLHGLYLTDASSKERELHTFNMRYFQDQATNYWKTHTNPRQAQRRLTKRATGEFPRRRSSLIGRAI